MAQMCGWKVAHFVARMTQSLKHKPYWLTELSGSLGDLGTFLPLCLGLHLACDLPLTHTLFYAGIAHLITACFYRIPMPVQPMKAIAAMAIAAGLSPANIYLAGLITAVLLLLLTFSGSLQRLLTLLPIALIRGVQCLVAALLLKTASQWFYADATSVYQQADWLVLACMVGCLLVSLVVLIKPTHQRIPLALLLTIAGFVYAGYSLDNAGMEMGMGIGVEMGMQQMWWPSLSWPGFFTAGTEWPQNVLVSLELAAAQLPMTLLNSVAAVVLLSRDLYPTSTSVTANKLGYTVGGLNIIAPLFGGMPVCHGSGGLAAQHQFGARSQHALLWLGGLKIALPIIMGTTLIVWVQAFPLWLLSIMLMGAAIPLLKHGLKLQGWSAWFIASSVVAVGLISQSLYGIAAGILLCIILSLLSKPSLNLPLRPSHKSPNQAIKLNHHTKP